MTVAVAWALGVAAAPKAVLFMGDSDVEGWKTKDDFDDSKNVGVGGFTCKDVLDKVDSKLEKHAPTWMVLVCGENDLAYGASVKKTFSRFQSVVGRAADRGVRVLYVGTKPEPSTTKLHDAYEAYDEKIRAWARQLAATASEPPLVMIDSYRNFEALGNPTSLYKRDKLHLSNAGYALWTKWALHALGPGLDSDGDCILWLDDEVCDARADGGDGGDGDEESCANDPEWHKKNKQKKTCDWVAKKPKRRCRAKDSDKTRAFDGCPVACDTCPASDSRRLR